MLKIIVTNSRCRERSSRPNERLTHELYQKYRNAVVSRLFDPRRSGAVVCDCYPQCPDGNSGGPCRRFHHNRQIEPIAAQLTRFGIVDTSVIHGQAAAAVRRVNLNEPVTELNVAKRVIFLGLNFGRDNRIDTDH